MALLQLTNYPVPPYAAAIQRRNLVPILAMTVVWIAWLSIFANDSLRHFVGSLIVYLAVIAAFTAPTIARLRALWRRVSDSEFRVCTVCGFDLRTLPDQYQCPECGTAYDYETLTKQWKEWCDTRATFFLN